VIIHMSGRQNREAPNVAYKIFIDNEGKLPIDFVAFKNNVLHCEHQLEVPLFQRPQPHDYIPPSCSYYFFLGYHASSYSHPFSKMSFDGVGDPLLHPIMIKPHLKIKIVLGAI